MASLGRLGEGAELAEWAPISDVGRDRVIPPPRNPGRAPASLEDAIHGMFVQPAYDIGMGVGSMVEGQGWNNPEAGAGLLAAMGLLTPMKAGVLGPRTMAPAKRFLTDIHGNQVEEGFPLYHVSPHNYDKLDMSKIGTGQGAQVKGHGLYGAQSPKVSGGPGSEYWNEFAQDFINRGGTVGQAVKLLEHTKGDRQKAIELLNRVEQTPERAAVMDLLRSDQPVGPISYLWNVREKPEHFLDWDRPTPALRDIAKDVGLNRDASRNVSDVQSLLYETGSSFKSPGELTYAAATRVLRDAGIPGIKYLDQGSRVSADQATRLANLKEQLSSMKNVTNQRHAATEIARLENEIQNAAKPTSNYVLFSANIIDILKKWGLTGLVSGAAATGGDNGTPR